MQTSPTQSSVYTPDSVPDRRQVTQLHSSFPIALTGRPAYNGVHDVCQDYNNRDTLVGGVRDGPALPADSHITLVASDKLNPNQGIRDEDMRDVPLPVYSTLVLNIGPTCPLDGILLDFLAERRQRGIEGESPQKLTGPAYPSFASLLKPERSLYSHPLSRVFTDILSTFPDIATPPERVAVLYVMFLVMRWQISPTKENHDRLPEWVKPRPSQLFTPHPAWIDHLPWPDMRDEMVATYQNYPFEEFFIPYTTTISLSWPYNPNDVVLSLPDTEELSINPVFESHLRDLDNWTLGPAFARAHPKLSPTVKINPWENNSAP